MRKEKKIKKQKKTTRVDEPEPTRQSEQAETKQCKQKKCIQTKCTREKAILKCWCHTFEEGITLLKKVGIAI